MVIVYTSMTGPAAHLSLAGDLSHHQTRFWGDLPSSTAQCQSRVVGRQDLRPKWAKQTLLGVWIMSENGIRSGNQFKSSDAPLIPTTIWRKQCSLQSMVCGARLSEKPSSATF